LFFLLYFSFFSGSFPGDKKDLAAIMSALPAPSKAIPTQAAEKAPKEPKASKDKAPEDKAPAKEAEDESSSTPSADGSVIPSSLFFWKNFL